MDGKIVIFVLLLGRDNSSIYVDHKLPNFLQI
jgi:hypothetical protein